MVTDGVERQPDGPRARAMSMAALLAITILLLAGVGLILKPFAEVLLAAVMLTICFYPVYEWTHARIRNADAAALFCVLLLIMLLLVPLAALGTVVGQEARSAYAEIERQSAAHGGWAKYLAHVADEPVRWIGARTGIAPEEIKAAISERAQQAGAKLVAWSGKLFGNVAATTTDILLTLFIMLFLFPAGERLGEHLHEYVPIRRDRLDLILGTMKSAIVANLYGMIAVAASQGALVGIGFALSGLASPVLWGFVASFCSLIPLVGTAFVVAPAAIALAVSGAYGKAVFLAVWGVVVVGMSDNIVRPMVLKKGMEMNTLAIFLSLMGGVQAFGFIGLFAGPVLVTMACVMVRIVNEERLAWQGEESAAVSAQPPAIETGDVPPAA